MNHRLNYSIAQFKPGSIGTPNARWQRQLTFRLVRRTAAERGHVRLLPGWTIGIAAVAILNRRLGEPANSGLVLLGLGQFVEGDKWSAK